MEQNTEIKRMSVQEFREQGYLQELNRRFLHPLGLSLDVVVDPTGTESFGPVWDGRENPEGMMFDPGTINFDHARRIHEEGEAKYDVRYARYGWYTQPYRPRGQ